MNTEQFSPWTTEAWLRGARGQEDVTGQVRWDGLTIPQVVVSPDSPLAFPASEAGWEIQQGFSTHDALMQGLMQGVEGIRTSAEGVDGPHLRDLLKEVHPEMVALHVDGYDTVGALRAVVAWANGVDVKGSSTWDVGRSCAFDEEALALHAEAWHAALQRTLQARGTMREPATGRSTSNSPARR